VAKQPSKGGKTPTKSRKKPVNSKTPVESIKAETVIDAIPPEVHPAKDPAPKPDIAKAQAQPVADVPKDVEEPKVEKVAAAPPAPTPAPPPPQRGGFLPLALGGLIAGAIGFFIATQTNQTDTTLADQLAAQSASIASLESQVASLPTVDLSSVETAQAELASNIEAVQTQLVEGLDALDVRVADLERLPTGDGTISERAIAAYEADLEALRAEMEAMGGTAIAQLDEARAEAAAIEENAAAAARAAAGRAALARIQTSLDNGEPLGAALADLEAAIGGPAPAELLAAQDGVPTLAVLQEGFPEAANAALAAARSAGVSGEETTGLGAFLKNQFDVRSVSPQEGTTTDAILSRAEAAIKSGRLSDALAEVAALPEEARVEMTDWLGQAETRAGAATAVDILSTSLNDS